MFNKKNVALVALSSIAGLFIASNASAAVSAPGAYVGGGIGWGTINQPGFNDAYDNKTTDNGVAGRVYVGVDLNQYLGAELGFTKFSDMDTSGVFASSIGPLDASGKIQTYAFDAVAKGTLPLQNGFNLFGKLGVAYLNEKASVSITDVFGDSASDTSVIHAYLPTFGAGISYDINKNVAADVSWMRIQKVNDTDLKSTDTVMFGVSYHFG
jgi:OOP family OmpA-OmpF porin